MNNTTRKYPRTLWQAFGPHTSNVIETERFCLFRSVWRFLRQAVLRSS